MKIEEFEDLTRFILDEYDKVSNGVGINQPSNDFLQFVEKTLMKYSKVYDKPLYKLQKRAVKLLYRKKKLEYAIDEAIFTMPHGWLWKFFHYRLWQKVKARLSVTDTVHEPAPDPVPPKVVFATLNESSPPEMLNAPDGEN